MTPSSPCPPGPGGSDLPEPVNLDDLLEPFTRRGVDLGLERLWRALAEGGHPERRFAAVQVAGTNGKGSIVTFLHAILRAAGVRSGAYRSPHLVSWCERIQLGDAWIGAGDLRHDLACWSPLARRHDLTPFELLTAAAFGRFAISGLELVVLEVGLGGRLDATTTHPDRAVVGFAAIGLDHREHLGDTLAAIAAEKAGVMTPGCLAISAPQPPEAAAVLEAEARRLGCRLRWVDPLRAAPQGGPPLGLAGDLQRSNGAVASAMAEALAERGWPITREAIERGLAEARWPGRLELRHHRGRPLLLDGAHNPPAAEALRRELDRPAAGLGTCGARRWLLGIQRHKEGAAMLRRLLAPGDRALMVPIPHHASWTLADLGGACPELAAQVEAVADLATALERLHGPWAEGAAPPGTTGTGGTHAGGAADGEGPWPVVAGSLHLLGAVLPLLDPPAAGRSSPGMP